MSAVAPARCGGSVLIVTWVVCRLFSLQVYDSTTKLKVEELVGASKESLEKMIQKYA